MTAAPRRYEFKGLMAPTFAPFTADGCLNLAVIPRYAQLLHDTGITGVYVNGTMGEGASMTTSERKEVAEAWAKVRDMVGEVVMQVGGASLRDAQDLARHTASLGLSAVACLPPLYDRPEGVEALIDYCRDVASAAPQLPFLYYHIPCKTDVQIPMDEFLEKAAPVIPNLVGIKFTSMEVASEGARCLRAAGGCMTVLSGFDQTLSEARALGFPGAINGSFNFMGLEAGRLFCLAGLSQDDDSSCCVPVGERRAEVERLQDKMNVPWTLISKYSSSSMVSGAKAVMLLLTGLSMGPARKPQMPMASGAMNALKQDLEEAGFKCLEAGP